MFVMIYEQHSGSVVSVHESDRDTVRPLLMALREQNPENSYIMTTGETVEACQTRAESLRAQFLERAEFMASLPKISGSEITHEEWDAAMPKLSQRLRGKAANLAAHSYAVMPHDDGLILIGHVYSDSNLYAGDTITPIEAPRICKTCVFSKKYAQTSRLTIPCSIGHDGTHFVIRQTTQSSTCSGWKKV